LYEVARNLSSEKLVGHLPVRKTFYSPWREPFGSWPYGAVYKKWEPNVLRSSIVMPFLNRYTKITNIA